MEGTEKGFNYPRTPGESVHKDFAQTKEEIEQLKEAIRHATRRADERRRMPESDEVMIEEEVEGRAPKAPQQERRLLERNLQEAIERLEKIRETLREQVNPPKESGSP